MDFTHVREKCPRKEEQEGFEEEHDDRPKVNPE